MVTELCEWCNRLVPIDTIIVIPYKDKKPFKVCVECANKVKIDE